MKLQNSVKITRLVVSYTVQNLKNYTAFMDVRLAKFLLNFVSFWFCCQLVRLLLYTTRTGRRTQRPSVTYAMSAVAVERVYTTAISLVSKHDERDHLSYMSVFVLFLRFDALRKFSEGVRCLKR